MRSTRPFDHHRVTAMPFRIARVPLVAAEHVISPGGVDVTLRAYQPIVWVRLVSWAAASRPEAVVFPAVVDTGNNEAFLIPAPLFRAWARVDDRELPTVRPVLVNGHPLNFYGFNLDLMRLRDGEPADRVAARLQTGQGIMIIPD